MSIKTELRSDAGKGIARKLRLENKIPAILYGAEKDSQSLALNAHDVQMAIQAGGFFTNMQELDIDGKIEKALPRDIQRHPVSSKIMHVDFLRFNPKQKLKVMVGVRVVGEEDSPGLIKGGVLQLIRSEIEVLCRADSIPDEIVVSIAGKDIGEAAHMSETQLPDGVESVIQDRDFTIASVVSTRSSNLEDEAETVEGEEVEGEETEASDDSKKEEDSK